MTYLLTKPLFVKEDLVFPDIIAKNLKNLQLASNQSQEKVSSTPVQEENHILDELNRFIKNNDIKAETSRLPSFCCIFFNHLDGMTQKMIANRLNLENFLGASVVSLHEKSKHLAESVVFTLVVCIVIGARLFDVIFYQDLSFVLAYQPASIFKIWEGGLASHGGAFGLMVGIFLVTRRKVFKNLELNWLRTADLLVIPTSLVSGFIRVGNFINQEILGKPTRLPWAVIFGHPADGSAVVPRHPVQIYEALVYFFLLVFFSFSWSRLFTLKQPGKCVGLFLLLLFSARFGLEFLKTEQSVSLTKSYLSMGQYLSVPFILLGAFLFVRKAK